MIMMNATAVMSDANIMMKSGYYIMVLLRIDEMQIVVRNPSFLGRCLPMQLEYNKYINRFLMIESTR
jgi:hypothetical protein